MQHLTRAEGKRILNFCFMVLDLLNMPRHELTLSDTPSDEGTFASIFAVPLRYAALLKVASNWATLDGDEKANTLVHEMLHLTHVELEQDPLKLLKNSSSVSDELYGSVDSLTSAHLERWVDRMAEVIVRGFGLTWPEPKKREPREQNGQDAPVLGSDAGSS